MSDVATLSGQEAVERLPLVASSSDINGTVLDDTIVQKNCSLHIRGNLLANLTIESGAKVVVEGLVDGKIVNRGGRLVVNNKPHVCFTPESGRQDSPAVSSHRNKDITHHAIDFPSSAANNFASCP